VIIYKEVLIICFFGLTDIFAENEVKLATWEMGCGMQLGEDMFAGGGNYADTNRDMHLGQ